VKFPVLSLIIREFDAESSSHQTASSATQSSIFTFSAENSKIARVSAHFLEPEGTGEARIRPYAADFRYILSVENLAGALRTALNRRLRQDIAFSFGIEASAPNQKTSSRS
jgi:hypothetical protein